MNRPDGIARAPGGRAAPLRSAIDPDRIGRAIRPGVIVEMDPATAEACGRSRAAPPLGRRLGNPATRRFRTTSSPASPIAAAIPCGWQAPRTVASIPTGAGGRTSKSRTLAGRCGAARRAARSSSGSSRPASWHGTARASRCWTARAGPVYETKLLASPRVYRYTVFNAEQCDGLPPRPRRVSARGWDRHEAAERVFKQSGAVIEHSGDNRAYYDLRRDRIVLPFKEQFPNGPSYYQSALHELGHWTGHPSRLNRRMLLDGIEHGYGSHAYPREELRAEISSMMTGDRLNIGHDPSRHASYVDSWVQKLREDPEGDLQSEQGRPGHERLSAGAGSLARAGPGRPRGSEGPGQARHAGQRRSRPAGGPGRAALSGLAGTQAGGPALARPLQVEGSRRGSGTLRLRRAGSIPERAANAPGRLPAEAIGERCSLAGRVLGTVPGSSGRSIAPSAAPLASAGASIGARTGHLSRTRAAGRPLPINVRQYRQGVPLPAGPGAEGFLGVQAVPLFREVLGAIPPRSV